MNKYSTIGNIQIGQFLISEGNMYKRIKNSCHPSKGCVKVFESETGKRLIFEKSKDKQRVLCVTLNIFEL